MGLRRRVRGARAIAAAAVLVVLALAPGTGTAGAATRAGLAPVPGISPPGANDWSCHPTARRPVPVILVHGTFGDMTVSWNALSPLLKADGFCVYALDYGARGTARMEASADELAAFARRVLSATGAAKVSFVGHSQGGALARLAVRYRGLLSQTQDVVGLAPSSHGTTNPLALPAGVLFCPACLDQLAGSPEMQHLNAPPEAPSSVDWTVVSTRYDEVVLPYRSQALSGSTVTNVVLQDRCRLDVTDHLGIIYDPAALQWTLNALRRAGPADPAFRPACV